MLSAGLALSRAPSSTAPRTSSADSRPSGCARSWSLPRSAASGLIFLAVLLPFIGGAWRRRRRVGCAGGTFGVIAIALLYACLAIGPMSILSPLTAVVSAIAPMLWGLFVNGETLSAIGYLGLGVALVAVVLVGFIPGEQVVRPRRAALLMAIGAGLAIGGVPDRDRSDEPGERARAAGDHPRRRTSPITSVIVGMLVVRGAPDAAARGIALDVSGVADRRDARAVTPISSTRAAGGAMGVPASLAGHGCSRSSAGGGCRGERRSCCSPCAPATCRSSRRSPRCTPPGRSSSRRSC